MTDGARDATLAGAIVDHPERRLIWEPSGGFTLETAGAVPVRVTPSGKAWKLSGPPLVDGASLRRCEDSAGGFTLVERDGETLVGRTTPMESGVVESGVTSLLLANGCLFRILFRGPRDARFELLGLESPGAYITARPCSAAWKLTATPAGGGIPELLPLSVLFAAVIAEAESVLVGLTTPPVRA